MPLQTVQSDRQEVESEVTQEGLRGAAAAIVLQEEQQIQKDTAKKVESKPSSSAKKALPEVKEMVKVYAVKPCRNHAEYL